MSQKKKKKKGKRKSQQLVSKAAGYKTNKQKLFTYLYTNNEHEEIKNTIYNHSNKN